MSALKDCGFYRKKGVLTILLIVIISLISCDTPLFPDKTKTKSELPLQPSINDSVFDNIHQQLYENPSLARKHSLNNLDIIQVEDPISKIILLKYIGSSYVLETNYPDAIEYYNKALALAENINLYFEMGNIYNNLGTVFNESGSYTSAYIHFVAAMDNYDLAGTPEKKKGTLNNIGLTYLNLKNNKKALSYFEAALEASPKNTDRILIASILNNIALCHSFEDNASLAIKNLNRSISISEKIDNKYGLSISYKIMGDIYLATEDYDKAFEAYTKSERISEDAGLFHQMVVAKVGLGRFYLDRNQIEDALKIALKAKNMAEEKNSLMLKTDVYYLLSLIYQKKNEHQKSLEHFQEHVSFQEEMNNTTIVNQIYDVELKQLDQLNQMQQLEIEKKELSLSRKNTLLFSLFLGLALMSIGFYLAYRNHHHKQETKLRETIIELNKKKSNAALEAEIKERKRIGKDLHDSLGYLLSLAGLNASVLESKKDITEKKREEVLTALMESIDDAFEEVRNISHNLAPSLLSTHGLVGALKNISVKVNQSSNLKMSYDTFNLDQDLDYLIENVLYRTIQEIVNNTLKHAEASKLFIQLAQDDHEITLMAEDDGKGFVTEEIQSKVGVGLSHITSGIENLNGTIYIDSKPGRGTIISILIPLQ
ncbi:MAG TPA: tetratricopeptide repeat protein [Aequorivita sp.]|nr:tetratricopeptide repeat protein [Aequorivita sp.]